MYTGVEKTWKAPSGYRRRTKEVGSVLACVWNDRKRTEAAGTEMMACWFFLFLTTKPRRLRFCSAMGNIRPPIAHRQLLLCIFIRDTLAPPPQFKLQRERHGKQQQHRQILICTCTMQVCIDLMLSSVVTRSMCVWCRDKSGEKAIRHRSPQRWLSYYLM